MKTLLNLTILIFVAAHISSCAVNKNLSYDDDVYGDFKRPAIAGNATSDDFFENQDYYNEEYAKNNNITYQSNSENAGVNTNYYGGYGSANTGCGCNNTGYYGNPYHTTYNNHYGYGNGYGCNNNFYNPYYGNSWGNPYGYYNPGWNSGWGMGATYGYNTWGNPYYGYGSPNYGWGNNYYGNGFYYGGNPYNNGWGNNNWGGGWNEPNNTNTFGGPQGGGMSSGSTGTSGYGTSGNLSNSSDIYNLTTSHVKSGVVRPDVNSPTDVTPIGYSDKKPVATSDNPTGMVTNNGTTQNFNHTLSSITSTKPVGHVVSKPNTSAVYNQSNFDNSAPKEIVKSPSYTSGNSSTTGNTTGSVWSSGKTDVPANTGKHNATYTNYGSSNTNTYYNTGSSGTGTGNNNYYNSNKGNAGGNYTNPTGGNYNTGGSGNVKPTGTYTPVRTGGSGGSTPTYTPSPSMGGSKPSGGSIPSGTVKPAGGSIGNVRGGK